jgi:hypothetical protein
MLCVIIFVTTKNVFVRPDVFITLSKEASSFTSCTYITVVTDIEDFYLCVV